MKRRYRIAGALVLMSMLAVVLLLLPSAEQENAATVVEKVNKVDAHPRPKDDWQPAVVGMTVYGGGQVRTGVASWAQLELLEGMVCLHRSGIKGGMPIRSRGASQG